MSLNDWLTTCSVREIFSEEITALSGAVSDTFDDGSRLFLRSILPQLKELRPDDRVQGGVALRATDENIWIHPYVYRQVCSNGAIMAHAVQTRHIRGVNYLPEGKAKLIVDLREAIRSCCDEQAFSSSAEELRSALEIEADLVLALLPLMSRIPQEIQAKFMNELTDHFIKKNDRSRFALMNTVTAVARDTTDPEIRWRLEELGGGIPTVQFIPKQSDNRRTELPRAFKAA